MRVLPQQTNNYFNKQNVSIKKTNKASINYTTVPFNNFDNTNFTGSGRVGGAGLLNKIKNGVLEKGAQTQEIIGKTMNSIVDKISIHEKNLEPFKGSLDEIITDEETRLRNVSGLWKKSKARDIKDEALKAKTEYLDEFGNVVAGKRKAADENMQAAVDLPEELKKFDNSNKLTRAKVTGAAQRGTVNNIDKFGFDKIASYERIKGILTNYFIKPIELEKAGEKVAIDGSVLLLGPTGNGKTTFSLALAEQTGCHLEKIETGFNLSPKRQQELMAKLIEKAEEAEKKFKIDNTRTILFIDELTKLISIDSSILKEFEEFAKVCSEKYHCTIMGATNHPSKFGIDLTKTEAFPVRISIDPPDREDSIEIFKHYLNDRTEGNIDADFLSDELIKLGKEKGGVYSNSQIQQICEETGERLGDKKIKQSDLLEYIRRMKKEPALSSDTIKSFEADVDKYIPDQV